MATTVIGNKTSYVATVTDYLEPGDKVTITRAKDVLNPSIRASYTPPTGLTEAAAGTPVAIPLEAIAQIIDENDEIGMKYGFALALGFGATYETEPESPASNDLQAKLVEHGKAASPLGFLYFEYLQARANGDTIGADIAKKKLKALGFVE